MMAKAKDIRARLKHLAKKAEDQGLGRAIAVARRRAENTTDPREAVVASAIASDIQELMQNASQQKDGGQ